MAKKEWLDWFKCNVLEIIILILVIVLLVKVFSAPEAAKETLVVEEQAPAPTELIEETIAPPAAEGIPSEETPAAGAEEGITG